MAAIECGRGHLYDPNTYSSCPYCNSSQQAINFSGTPVGQGGKTMPLSGGYVGASYGDSGKTVPASGQPSPVPGGVSVITDSKTAPPKGYIPVGQVKVTEENQTVGMMREKHGIDPAVGWLVCVAGKQKGQDYRIKGQINSIGRGEKNDVCIKGDNTISNDNHARLSYSEKNNRFNLIPAENKNIIYLNGEEVFAATPLSAFDVIDFGETKLVFVPLCCDKFDWNSNIAGGGKDGSV